MEYIFDHKLNILGFWRYLSKKRKKQLFGIIVLSLLSGLSELLTISSILPFLAVISSPNNLSSYPISVFLSNLLYIPLNEEIYISTPALDEKLGKFYADKEMEMIQNSQ